MSSRFATLTSHVSRLPRLSALSALALAAQLSALGCAPIEGDESESESIGGQSEAMIDQGGGGADCGSCVGGECAELNCFENWTHSGGGGGGPYTGGGGGGGGGGTGGGSGGGTGGTCHRDALCVFACSDNVLYPCLSTCSADADGPAGIAAYKRCRASCSAADAACNNSCCH
jgi:hypothetical protein